jgi:cellobiose phosphorylase
MYRVLFEGFAGITPEFDGLRIEPRLPAEWRRITVKRPFRGGVCNITIDAPSGASRGVKALHVNGKATAGNVVPVSPGPGETDIRVVLGS